MRSEFILNKNTNPNDFFFSLYFWVFLLFLFFHYIFEENWTFLQWAKSFLRNQTQKQYSNPKTQQLSQYILSSQNLSSLMAEIPIMETPSLSLFSHLKPELSLFSHGRSISWLKTHGLSSSLNPWLKTHGRISWLKTQRLGSVVANPDHLSSHLLSLFLKLVVADQI